MFCPICKKYNEKLKKEIEMEKHIFSNSVWLDLGHHSIMHFLICPVCSFWLPCSDYGITLEKLMEDD